MRQGYSNDSIMHKSHRISSEFFFYRLWAYKFVPRNANEIEYQERNLGGGQTRYILTKLLKKKFLSN